VFSSRVPADRRPNAFAAALARARCGGEPLLDLTTSNPTQAGIPYPPRLLDALADPAGLDYRPEPFGLRGAREAVARDFARRGIRVTPDHIVLTASTSEAYSFLFRTLCDPGQDVLTPVPSYPLFDHLARLDGVDQRTYRLVYHGRWCVEPPALDEAWTDETRAVLAVSPNNPTGSTLGEEDARELTTRCAARGAALIVDEVFADYGFERELSEAGALGQAGCLLFRLGGLSKTAGLPQIKLGWIAVDGPAALVDDVLDRLEWICDTYLSVSTPVQLAAPRLLAEAAAVRAAILERVRLNHATLGGLVSAVDSVELLHADGGWSAVLRVPATAGEEQFVLALLEEDRIVVHPGFFFDFPHEAFVIVSLLAEPSAFARGAARVLERADAA
jgi:alanine-synthesizing transaminase